MLAHLHRAELDIDTIAKAQNVSPRTLNRLFATDGTTPIRWLWQQRLDASYKALAEGHVTQVTDAAMSFGFTDMSHFSRVFKKTFGTSPAPSQAEVVTVAAHLNFLILRRPAPAGAKQRVTLTVHSNSLILRHPIRRTGRALYPTG